MVRLRFVDLLVIQYHRSLLTPIFPLLQKISGILNGARKEHTQAVQGRIDSVTEQRDVVDITKALFAVAKVS
jgi:hypothetical protein